MYLLEWKLASHILFRLATCFHIPDRFHSFFKIPLQLLELSLIAFAFLSLQAATCKTHYWPLFPPQFQPFTENWRASFPHLLTFYCSLLSAPLTQVPHTKPPHPWRQRFYFCSQVNSDLCTCIAAGRASDICRYCHIEPGNFFFFLNLIQAVLDHNFSA